MKLGVFSTRSPHRPNRMGISVVKFVRIAEKGDSVHLFVSGVDLVDETPIFDIKPYIPYADSVDAIAPLFETAPEKYQVKWKCESPKEKKLIEETIGLDPRPGHQKDENTEYGMSVAGLNVRFRKSEEVFEILQVTSL